MRQQLSIALLAMIVATSVECLICFPLKSYCYFSLCSGMHLSAESPKSNKVFVQFDRGCITASGCECKRSCDLRWCAHILTLILTRIRKANTTAIVVHPPLSETLSQFNRDQLQKLVQYIVEKHPLEVVPSAQAISSELQDVASEISIHPGAPGMYLCLSSPECGGVLGTNPMQSLL